MPDRKIAEPKTDNRGKPIAISTRIKARNMYVVQGLSSEIVAEACGLTKTQVYSLAHHYGWAKTRKKSAEMLSASVDDRTAGLVDEVSSAIASECEELVMSGLARAKEAVKDTHKDAPKNYQAWTAGVRNLASARSIIKNNTASSSDAMDTGARHLNLFFMGVGVAAQKEKRVAPLADAAGGLADVL